MLTQAELDRLTVVSNNIAAVRSAVVTLQIALHELSVAMADLSHDPSTAVTSRDIKLPLPP